MPANVPLCADGTCEADPAGLSRRRVRPGPGMAVCRRTAAEVLSRIGDEVRGYTRVIFALSNMAILCLGLAFFPEGITGSIPVVPDLVGANG